MELVSQSFLLNPQTSQRRAARELDISRSRVIQWIKRRLPINVAIFSHDISTHTSSNLPYGTSKSSSINKLSKTDEKVLRVEDSLKDLSSIKRQSEHNRKRLWPHDQWPEHDLVNYPPYKLHEGLSPVR
ncbi:unnamed protein product [Rotaria sordida]|uniref:Uncharacterized protein n=1 Tax=Rotaria sordida TaxID=392033 RepID=A0A818JNU9_9BILA|nr:unnamed protein product [Rotaria sordida]CAF0906704.1 unnamed protein product [Rotaria sordida]CAF1032396.1 unnamed protein product [Rotaria sordida]CAF3541714.1 unnamed protein product [Rotaria sordida]CAF3829469.1 unnamed protein product [Rotaria sordida]